MGDFEDLSNLLIEAKRKTGADFTLINPVHAAEPVSPLTPSPYLPVSRSLVNFTYIRPEAIEEYRLLGAESLDEIRKLFESIEPLNNKAEKIDRDVMWHAKMQALWIIFKAGRTSARQREFADFCAKSGEDLEAYATWCLCYDKWGSAEDVATNWIHRYTKESPEVQAAARAVPRHVELLPLAGMDRPPSSLTVPSAMPATPACVSVSWLTWRSASIRSAPEVWWCPSASAKGATVGAPPDMFNQQGQDWSQPPLNPIYLDRTGYKVYRDMVHNMFTHAGAVRIDHILGLFRLWWIPSGRKADDGAYVRYDSDVMLGILALEASRADGVVVGEDLGRGTGPCGEFAILPWPAGLCCGVVRTVRRHVPFPRRLARIRLGLGQYA